MNTLPLVTAHPEAGRIDGEIFIAAPPEAVFQALTDPAELAAWWRSPAGYTTHAWVFEARVGGHWGCQIANSPTGKPQSVGGKILHWEPHARLSYTWLASWDGFKTTVITYDLQEVTGGTLLRIDHTGFDDEASCQAHTQGWRSVLTWLCGRVTDA